jgi:hypothetical protein
MKWLLWRLRAVGLRALLLSGPRRLHRGIRLGVIAPLSLAEEFLTRVVDALDLIARVDPVLLDQASRYLKRIVLVAGGGEVYLHPIRAYLVDPVALRRRTTVDLAGAIVHEAMHARLAANGTGYDEAERPKIEKDCVTAEVTFLEKAGGPPELIAKRLAELESEWWTADKLKQRRRRQLEAHGIRLPELVARLFKRSERR